MAVAVAPSIRLPLKSLSLTPGSCLTLEGLSWAEFEEIQAAYDERSGIRVAYCDGTLELKACTVVQQRISRLVAQLVKTLLDIENKDWEDFGRSTLKLEKKLSCVEPDTGFYIYNSERMRAHVHIILEVDPSPDLVIECDLASEIRLEAYKQLRVPEIWIVEYDSMTINLLADGEYKESETSLVVKELKDIRLVIPQLLNDALEVGSRQMLQNLRWRLDKVDCFAELSR